VRFNLRLYGRTSNGKPCQADISVYAHSQSQLEEEAKKAGETAAWRGLAGSDDWVPEGSQITVESVEVLKGKK